ncbi:hypothetical protein BC829DRAFT_224655 [Chytridium lagenaria]|nr:hypothetical protein BC829DRAFT_224655 [Chytridium lagenaria]
MFIHSRSLCEPLDFLSFLVLYELRHFSSILVLCVNIIIFFHTRFSLHLFISSAALIIFTLSSSRHVHPFSFFV